MTPPLLEKEALGECRISPRTIHTRAARFLVRTFHVQTQVINDCRSAGPIVQYLEQWNSVAFLAGALHVPAVVEAFLGDATVNVIEDKRDLYTKCKSKNKRLVERRKPWRLYAASRGAPAR